MLRGTLKDLLHDLSKKAEIQEVEALKERTNERVRDLQSKLQVVSRELACARAEAADNTRVADIVRAVQSKADQDDIEVCLQKKVQPFPAGCYTGKLKTVSQCFPILAAIGPGRPDTIHGGTR